MTTEEKRIRNIVRKLARETDPEYVTRRDFARKAMEILWSQYHINCADSECAHTCLCNELDGFVFCEEN